MYNETYDEYIRSILGYPPMNTYNNQNYFEQNNNFNNVSNPELESCYPEIYKIVYPMVKSKCNNSNGNVSREDVENMTDEIYYALEQKEVTQLNINLNNDIRTTQMQNRSTKVQDKKPEVKIAESSKIENRETRQFNSGLRDLIKILLIRELLNRPGRPGPNPRPPYPGPRPPQGRPPFGPGPVRPPFNREFEASNYDIYEY